MSSLGIVVVFIAAEEGGEKKIGVDMIMEKGKLEEAIICDTVWYYVIFTCYIILYETYFILTN